MERLLEAAGGLTRMVTLAPERDPNSMTTRMLADRGIVVSAGHSDASLDQLRTAIDAGLSMYTHLGNGCPLVMHRHDNIIQRVLSLADRMWVCFIADGVHVPFVALKNYLQVIGTNRAIVVTDAIAAAGMGPGVHQLAGQRVVVDDNLATWAEDRSHLVGSAMTMPQAVENLRTKLGYDGSIIAKLTCENPRLALGV
jgi:N-acetylglucosamine-6-phosphate deacetylase